MNWKLLTILAVVAVVGLSIVGFIARTGSPSNAPINTPVATATNAAATATSAEPSDPCARFGTPKKAISDLLARKDWQKDEYETSAEHQKRVAKIYEPLGAMTASVHMHENFSEYDADHGSLILGIPYAFGIYFSPSYETHITYSTAVLTRSDTLGEPYVASNAFGATAKVQVIHSDETDILILQRSGVLGAWGNRADPRIQVKGAAAKALKNNLCLVVTGTPAAPFKIEGINDKKATITDPYETHTHTVGFVVRPSTGDVIDARSGTVLAHFDPGAIQQYAYPSSP